MDQETERPKSTPKEIQYEGTPLLKICQVLTFVLVCSMTIAQKPIQKAMDALSDKAERQANAKVCNQIYQKQDVFDQHMRTYFASGCLWVIRNFMLEAYDKDKKKQEEIRKVFKEKNSLEFDKYADNCQSGAAANQKENEIKERIVYELWTHFQCEKVKPEDMKDENNQ